ncbi:alpha-galactosidase, partial [Phenoliferia sp. Uapishka_3]
MMRTSTTLALLSAIGFTAAKDNGVGVLPALGWNTWNTFSSSIDAALIIESAQAMVDSGLSKLGYEYINIDDTWQETSRMANGTLSYNTTKFPDGFNTVTDQIHALGLKAGLYSTAGSLTCGGFPASLGYETEDATSYANWGFDYLKYDNCYNEGQFGNANISYARYEVMSDALNATGRPMLYSLCSWGQDNVWDWASTIANSYRISGDVYPRFDRKDDRCPCETYDCTGVQGYHCSITNIVEKSAPIGQKVRAGSFGDMDGLEVGNDGMSFTEQVSQMSMWAINRSPLILGNDIRNMTNDTMAIISNKAILSINQDSGTTPAYRVWKKDVAAKTDSTLPSWQVQPTTNGTLQLWSGGLTDGGGRYVITLFNTSPQNITLDVSLLEAFNSFDFPDVATKSYSVFDVWAPNPSNPTPLNATRAEIASTAYGVALPGTFCGSIPSVAVEAHGVRVFILSTNGTCASEEPMMASRMMGRRAWASELY